MDWTCCDLVERIPGKVSGQPIVRGTRILADTIVDDFDDGSPIDEILENYPALTAEIVDSLVTFAHAQHGELAS
jgi:uncharacterized protein (DUF433 family)